MGTLGTRVQLGNDWQLKVDGSYARENVDFEDRNVLDSAALTRALADTNPATALNVMGDGARNNPDTFEAIRADPLSYRGISDNCIYPQVTSYSSALTA